MTNRFFAALVVATTAAFAIQPAFAAAPRLKGKYSYHSFEICQIGLTFNKDAQGDVINLSPAGANHIGTIVGVLTFSGAAPNSGTIAFSAQKISGLPFKTNGTPAGVFSQSPETGSGGAYSNDATTLTLDADVYVVSYANIVSGVAKSVSFMFRSNGNTCFETGTLTRQN